MIFEKLVFTMGIICLMYPQFSTLMVKYEISFVLKRFLEESYSLYKLFEEALNTHALIAHRRWYVRLIRLDFIRLSLFLLRVVFLIIFTFLFRNIEELLFPYWWHIYLGLLSTYLGIISILFRCVFEFFSWFFRNNLLPWTCCPLSSVRGHWCFFISIEMNLF